jgi:hypothetical protein
VTKHRRLRKDTRNERASILDQRTDPLALDRQRGTTQGRAAVTRSVDFDVSIEATASEEELAAVRRAFEDAGLGAEVGAGLEFKSAGPETIVSVLVIGPLTVFLARFVQLAADDAYKTLKAFVQRVCARRERHATALWLQDETGRRVDIAFGPELPDDAYRAIFELDLQDIPLNATIRYEDEARDWMLVFERRPVPRRRKP